MGPPIVVVRRKVWKPSTSSTSLVVTLPIIEFLKENDTVKVSVTSDKKLIIEKQR